MLGCSSTMAAAASGESQAASAGLANRGRGAGALPRALGGRLVLLDFPHTRAGGRAPPPLLVPLPCPVREAGRRPAPGGRDELRSLGGREELRVALRPIDGPSDVWRGSMAPGADSMSAARLLPLAAVVVSGVSGLDSGGIWAAKPIGGGDADASVGLSVGATDTRLMEGGSKATTGVMAPTVAAPVLPGPR